MDEALVEMLDGLLPPDWEHNAGRYGTCFTLTCPHGHEVEQDGECPDGCQSPMRELGFV